MMKQQLERRLQELRGEFAEGQALLADLESRQTQLRSSLLRISGAIQVLEELLAEESPAAPPSQDGSAGAPEREAARVAG